MHPLLDHPQSSTWEIVMVGLTVQAFKEFVVDVMNETAQKHVQTII